MQKSYDVVVIGAGAAGMFCAALAGQRGRRVLLLDHMPVAGEKIRISGGGRCNFTNRDASPAQYLSENPHFARSALSRFTPMDFIAYLHKYAIAYHEKTLGQLFCDDSSQQIIEMLKQECAVGGVAWALGCTVERVDKLAEGFCICTAQGDVHTASLVIATGGLSIPQIGATPFGYKIAEQFDLPIVPPAPALVPLMFAPEDAKVFGALAGMSLDAEVRCNNGVFREALLVTHRGLSGPAILQISSFWRPGDWLHVNLIPQEPDVLAWLSQPCWRDKHLVTVLAEYLPKAFAQAWCAHFCTSKPMRQYTLPELKTLVELLTNWQLMPSGTAGYKKAEVTRGGVDTRALSSKTMMANQVQGLYFIGEVVDVTGWLGGYNFQWAWASAYAAAQVV